MSFTVLPYTPSREMGPPWYCAIRSDGLFVDEAVSYESPEDATAKAHALAKVHESTQQLAQELTTDHTR